MKPKGASFELVDSQQFVWSILATDVEFGYDGGVYVSDWVDGWDGAGKGRIYILEYTRPTDFKSQAGWLPGRLPRSIEVPGASPRIASTIFHFR